MTLTEDSWIQLKGRMRGRYNVKLLVQVIAKMKETQDGHLVT